MSLILDALRKAEAERKLGRAPTLASVSPWRVQRRVPLYVVVMIVLLGAVVALAGVLWFSRREPPAPGIASTPERAAPAPTRAPPAPARTPATTQAPESPAIPPSSLPPAPAKAPAQAGPQAKPPRPAPPTERLPTVVPATPPVPHLQPEPAAPAEALPPASSLPPPPARIVPMQPDPAAHTFAPAGPPTAAARSALGELKLTMHYYNADPARRFVILDGERYSEGQTTAKGMKVTEIRSDGVLGEFQGETFFLQRGGG